MACARARRDIVHASLQLARWPWQVRTPEKVEQPVELKIGFASVSQPSSQSPSMRRHLPTQLRHVLSRGETPMSQHQSRQAMEALPKTISMVRPPLDLCPHQKQKVDSTTQARVASWSRHWHAPDSNARFVRRSTNPTQPDLWPMEKMATPRNTNCAQAMAPNQSSWPVRPTRYISNSHIHVPFPAPATP